MTEFFNLPGLEGVDKILHPLILALPIFVVLTLIALVVRRRRAAKAKLTPESPQYAFAQKLVIGASEPAQLLHNPTEVENAAANAVLHQTNVALRQAAAPGSSNEPKSTVNDDTTSYADEREALQAQIDQVMKVQPNNTLAPLFLEMARHHKAAGDEAAYLAALRSAAGLGAQHGPRAAHAEARLQLAEAAHKAGDLTGACEQWQMARDALYDDGQKEAHARVEQRMRDNGCPTDWVLTDF